MKNYFDTSFEVSFGSSSKTKTRLAIFALLLLFNVAVIVTTTIQAIHPCEKSGQVAPTEQLDERP